MYYNYSMKYSINLGTGPVTAVGLAGFGEGTTPFERARPLAAGFGGLASFMCRLGFIAVGGSGAERTC